MQINAGPFKFAAHFCKVLFVNTHATGVKKNAFLTVLAAFAL